MIKFFSVLFCSVSLYAQQAISCNGDNISLLDGELLINNQTGTFHIKTEESFSVANEVLCLNDGFDFKITMQNGNEYHIYHYIFEKISGAYYITKIYTVFSDRNSYSVSGGYIRKIDFKAFFKDIALPYPLDVKMTDIQDVAGFQEGEEKDSINYYALVEKAYKAKNVSMIGVLVDDYVQKEVSFYESLSIEQLNNVAYYAQTAKAYLDAITMLDHVIKTSPERAVAYLNRADCLWETGNREKAIYDYEQYIALMKSQKKELKKIPEYVYGRIKTK